MGDNVPSGPTFLYFDGSVRYDTDGETPISAAGGYSIETAGSVLQERSLQIPRPVSSTHAEYHALLQAVQEIDNLAYPVESLYVYGDSESVMSTVDPSANSTPRDRFGRRQVAWIQSQLAEIPTVGYRTVPRGQNHNAHRLATRGHDPTGGD